MPREPGAPKPDPILVANNVVRRFGGLTAVNVDHVEIQRGAITALIGPNGAGKTTFFNLLTGFDQPDEGTWSFNDKPLKGMPPYKVARTGHGAHLPAHQGAVEAHRHREHAAWVPPGSAGNIGTPASSRRFGAGRSGPSPRAPTSCSLDSPSTPSVKTSPDRCQVVNASCLRWPAHSWCEPELVMLDEPMAGVNPALTQSLLGHVKDLREQGMTVLFVEHDMDMVRDISDWVIVMAQGMRYRRRSAPRGDGRHPRDRCISGCTPRPVAG